MVAGPVHLVDVPWGPPERMDDPALPAQLFAWAHYQQGHRYTVDFDRSTIECGCGDTFAGPVA